MKKTIIIFFLLCIFAPLPALAARAVSGTVPVNQPLQPMPEMTYPNIQNNIADTPETREQNSQASPASGDTAAQTEAVNEQDSLQTTGQPAAPHTNSARTIIFIILGILAIVIIGQTVRRYAKK